VRSFTIIDRLSPNTQILGILVLSTLLNACVVNPDKTGINFTALEERRLHFLSELPNAIIKTENVEWVRSAGFVFDEKHLDIIFQHPNSELTFDDVQFHRKTRLRFGYGMTPDVWFLPGDGVLFEIRIRFDEGTERTIFSRYIDPKNRPEDRQWFTSDLDVGNFDEESVSVIFRTSTGPNNDSRHDWAAWSDPVLVTFEETEIATPSTPNVVLISIDSLRRDRLGCYRYFRNTSPNIDQLADDSIVFDSAFSTAPSTVPAHMSLFTALYPAVHGVRFPSDVLRSNRLTLAEHMQAEGYLTAAYVDGGNLGRQWGFDKGFQLYDDRGGGLEAIRPKAIDFINAHASRPFFLFVHTNDVHRPFNPPPGYIRIFDDGVIRHPYSSEGRSAMGFVQSIGYHDYLGLNPQENLDRISSAYDGRILYADTEIGTILDALKNHGIYERTLIVVLSDHGESLFDRHVYFGHSLFLFDNEISIPLIVKMPGSEIFPSRRNELVSIIDVSPTILDVVHRSEPTVIQGQSLFSLINNKNMEGRSAVFGESSETGKNMFVRTSTIKFIEEFGYELDAIIGRFLRPNRPVNIREFIDPGEHLYYLPDDSEELQNVVGVNRVLAAKMRRSLQLHREENNGMLKRLEEPD